MDCNLVCTGCLVQFYSEAPNDQYGKPCPSCGQGLLAEPIHTLTALEALVGIVGWRTNRKRTRHAPIYRDGTVGWFGRGT